MRKLLLIAAALLLLTLSFLGGSVLSYLDGAHGLDIDGSASPVGRPAETIDVGQGWSSYGSDDGGHRYSGLADITPANVHSLEIAWEFSTGDLENRPELMLRSATEGTPILVEDSLVFCTPFNEVIALDPGTGAERWRFDAKTDPQQRPANNYVCRGVSHWRDENQQGACASRILMGTNDARLIAIDATNGRRCSEFGDNGEVRIDPGMELWWPGEFQITSPPAIIDDTVIVGSAIGDNARVAAPAGSVRAFDVRSGEPRWDFDPIPRSPTDPNRKDWVTADAPTEGHSNVWAPMSVDRERGLVFLPTTSPSPDFYGGLRPGDNRHANSVVALHAASGDVAWSFQTVHHDVWDYDVPAQPGLYSVWRDGAVHDVVAQVTKTGLVFVLDRDTGQPFLPVEERPVPQVKVAGEVLSPTQPFPVATPAIVPNTLAKEDAFGITWFDRRACQKRIESSLAEGLFTPPSEQGTILLPFTGGGANWGGAAFDPARNLLVVNMSNMAHHVQLFSADELDEMYEVFHDQEVSPQEGAPYGMKREPLLSPLKLPCNPPPWGVIAGVNIESGDIVWRKSIGTTEDLSLAPGMSLGTPTMGGPIITAGGLIFIGATMDHYLRAFDVETGNELWRGRLSAPGNATPMTYEWQGKQYVVIYAGGYARMDTTLGDRLYAFALPD
ncbi:MAG: pyrroloquinoline quinone-dependent dehydrogenase [Gammaproteobacteria bacterium]|nr:pyrroloquinoline quinone-dependent dehydrogenase [Gammaproteobacteria bacterium]